MWQVASLCSDSIATTLSEYIHMPRNASWQVLMLTFTLCQSKIFWSWKTLWKFFQMEFWKCVYKDFFLAKPESCGSFCLVWLFECKDNKKVATAYDSTLALDRGCASDRKSSCHAWIMHVRDFLNKWFKIICSPWRDNFFSKPEHDSRSHTFIHVTYNSLLNDTKIL